MPNDKTRCFNSDFPRDRHPHLYYSAKYFIPSTRAVIVDRDDRVLIVRRRSDSRWGLPGGNMTPGESAQECLERVVKVQTGLTVVESAPFIADSGKYARVLGNAETQMIMFGFRVRKWSGELMTETAETLDARWLWPSDAIGLLGYWHDDSTTIEDHNCTDYDPPVVAEGGIVWVR